VNRVAGRAVSRHESKLIISTKASVLILILLTVGTALLGPSCRSSPGTLPIGAYLPLTGPLASFGASARDGIELAVQEVNSGGGVEGKTLEVTYLDDESDPDRARDAVRRLVENLKVAAVLGGALSGSSLAGGAVCQEHGVPMVSPSATNPEVTELGEFIHRVCYVDSFQGTAMATFAYNSLRVSRVAMLSKSGDGYSEGLAEYFARTFRELGGTIVAEGALPSGGRALDSAVRRLLAASPDAVFLPLYYQDVSQVTRRLAEQRSSASLLGCDGWDSPDLLQLAGDAVEGAYFTTHFSPEDRRGRVRSFVRMFRERYDATPDAVAALGYDAAHLLAASLARLADEEPGYFNTLCWGDENPGGAAELKAARAKLRDMISSTEGFEGVTGEITIDESRNAVKPAVVLEVKSDGFRYAGVVKP
jgi:branched-chain amino acid transport system substrate-binding protein